MDADEDVHLEEEEDGDEKGWFVCAVDIIGFEQAVVTVSDDVWNVSLDISTMLRQGLRVEFRSSKVKILAHTLR